MAVEIGNSPNYTQTKAQPHELLELSAETTCLLCSSSVSQGHSDQGFRAGHTGMEGENEVETYLSMGDTGSGPIEAMR